MTIKERLKKKNRRFWIARIACLILTMAGGIAMVLQKIDDQAHDENYLVKIYKATGALDVPSNFLKAGVILTSVGIYAAAILPVYLLRCPQCKGQIGPLRKKWKHCPFCGVSLDEEVG